MTTSTSPRLSSPLWSTEPVVCQRTERSSFTAWKTSRYHNQQLPVRQFHPSVIKAQYYVISDTATMKQTELSRVCRVAHVFVSLCQRSLRVCLLFPSVCVFVCVKVYHTLFWPLEYTVANRDNNKCYGKIICNKLDSVRPTSAPVEFI